MPKSSYKNCAQIHRKKEKKKKNYLPNGVSGTHGIELDTLGRHGVDGVLLVKVDLEEADEALLDVGGPQGVVTLQLHVLDEPFLPPDTKERTG
jgi:hypothetical protein